MQKILPQEKFLSVLTDAKLTSLDLIIKNDRGEVLLGYRKNKPAQNSWFVPGGVIQKQEKIPDAFKRISLKELGTIPENWAFFALAEHSYEDNFANIDGISTEYIVTAISCSSPRQALTPDSQHTSLKWWPIKELLSAPEVHPYTKAYFQSSPSPDVIFFMT